MLYSFHCHFRYVHCHKYMSCSYKYNEYTCIIIYNYGCKEVCIPLKLEVHNIIFIIIVSQQLDLRSKNTT